jgi:hypothetical protein
MTTNENADAIASRLCDLATQLETGVHHATITEAAMELQGIITVEESTENGCTTWKQRQQYPGVETALACDVLTLVRKVAAGVTQGAARRAWMLARMLNPKVPAYRARILDSTQATTPEDIIAKRVALRRFEVTSVTLKRAVKQGKLRSFRPTSAPKNAEHQFSEAELATLYTRKPSR